jgi:hypothetical protein
MAFPVYIKGDPNNENQAFRHPISAARKASSWADQNDWTITKEGIAMAKKASTELSYVADLLAIEQLLHRYCHVLDRGTVDEIAELFHRDAVLLPVYESDDRHVGRDAVRSWYAHYDKTLRAGVRYLRHKIECPTIEISGDTATSISYLDADAIHKETDEPMIFIGRYDDKLIRDGGRWWFKERKIISYYIYSAGKYLEGRGE